VAGVAEEYLPPVWNTARTVGGGMYEQYVFTVLAFPPD